MPRFKQTRGAMIKKVSDWHNAIIEWMIVHPGRPHYEMAEYFGVTQPWLSCIINSDVFREKMAQRRNEHFEGVSIDTRNRLAALTDTTVEVLTERIQKERNSISLGLVRETADMALRASGFGAPKRNERANIVNIIGVDPATLAESRALMGKVIEMEEAEDAEPERLPISAPA